MNSTLLGLLVRGYEVRHQDGSYFVMVNREHGVVIEVGIDGTELKAEFDPGEGEHVVAHAVKWLDDHQSDRQKPKKERSSSKMREDGFVPLQEVIGASGRDELVFYKYGYETIFICQECGKHYRYGNALVSYTELCRNLAGAFCTLTCKDKYFTRTGKEVPPVGFETPLVDLESTFEVATNIKGRAVSASEGILTEPALDLFVIASLKHDTDRRNVADVESPEEDDKAE